MGKVMVCRDFVNVRHISVFEADPKWNNRQFAPNLIKFIKNLEKADNELTE